ncbi:hypothetical protein V1477_003826 [Vespula maculifrons]|uniref:Uncharacterized protein n=1 Tax=Vespula maculifrons TaxID=7453 RepID=A0ABD2CSF7_VESMC
MRKGIEDRIRFRCGSRYLDMEMGCPGANAKLESINFTVQVTAVEPPNVCLFWRIRISYTIVGYRRVALPTFLDFPHEHIEDGAAHTQGKFRGQVAIEVDANDEGSGRLVVFVIAL